MMKVLVLYYSQTGQLGEALESFCRPMLESAEYDVTFRRIEPVKPYPFPWKGIEFFEVFPESVLGIPVEFVIKGIEDNEYDLIILGWQIWFLHPSIPFSSFLQSPHAVDLLKGRKVVSLIACRNMWACAWDDFSKSLDSLGADQIANVVLRDRAMNFTSIITIVRWMFTGKKDRFLGIFPPAGVSGADIAHASKFGELLINALKSNNYANLQSILNDTGAVHVIPHLVAIEKTGRRIFRIWAGIIKKAGERSSKKRRLLLRIFSVYLALAIVLISPLVTLIHLAKGMIMPKANKKIKEFIR